MSFFRCEHPKRVYNKYIDRFLFVDCGRCNSCRRRKASRWTRKLNDESKCHPYTLFGTLTYSDEFLPKLVFDGDSFVDPQSFETHTLDKPLDRASYDYIHCFGDMLPVGRVSDCQRFIKRVRSRISSNPSRESRSVRYLRYFLVCEYGETAFRPHYHFLFFTGSKWFAENVQSVISSCWTVDARNSSPHPLGRTEVENVQNSASSYVASYLNCFDNLPEVYEYRFSRPFHLCSRSPSLGSLVEDSPEIRFLFDSGSVTCPLQVGRSGEFQQVTVPQSLCNRLYPKPRGFDEVSDDVFRGLLTRYLYGKYVEKASDQSVRYKDLIGCFGSDFKMFRQYFLYPLSLEDSCLGDYCQNLISDDTDKQSASHSVYTWLNRVIHQSRIFGVSVDDYFSRIRRFYTDRDYHLLNYQLSWEESVSRSQPVSSCLLVDPEFQYKYFSDSAFANFPRVRKIVSSYGSNDSVSCVALDSLPEFRSMCSKSKEIVDSCKKKRAKYEYLNSDKFAYSEDYRKFLINYHNEFYKNHERVAESRV